MSTRSCPAPAVERSLPPPAPRGPVATALADRGRTRPVVSFELYPPRSPAAAEALGDTLDHLAAAAPDYVSVTYGASGSTHDASCGLLADLLREHGCTVLAHLTCAGRDEAALRAVVEHFLATGVHGFLALRGDPPAHDPAWTPSPDALPTAADLVALLRRETALRRPRAPLDVAVAAYPQGHSESTGPAQDLAALRAKQAAGADFALTQVFFEPEHYLRFADGARAAGIAMPVVPGVLPLTDPARLERMSSLTGVPLPPDLMARLTGAEGAERHRIGVAATADLARAVLDGGAPGLHLYSMNRHEAVLDVLEALDLPAPPAPRTAPRPAAPATRPALGGRP